MGASSQPGLVACRPLQIAGCMGEALGSRWAANWAASCVCCGGASQPGLPPRTDTHLVHANNHKAAALPCAAACSLPPPFSPLPACPSVKRRCGVESRDVFHYPFIGRRAGACLRVVLSQARCSASLTTRQPAAQISPPAVRTRPLLSFLVPPLSACFSFAPCQLFFFYRLSVRVPATSPFLQPPHTHRQPLRLLHRGHQAMGL
jgi:hypothetical protein